MRFKLLKDLNDEEDPYITTPMYYLFDGKDHEVVSINKRGMRKNMIEVRFKGDTFIILKSWIYEIKIFDEEDIDTLLEEIIGEI